jgi:Fe2+ transport system protein FeoA
MVINMQDNSHDAQQDSNVAQNSHYSAADLKIGEEGIVSALNCDESMKHRLASMGIFAGASIKAPVTSAFGNPRSYMVRGYQLCMRTNEAMTILLKTNIPALSE